MLLKFYNLLPVLYVINNSFDALLEEVSILIVEFIAIEKWRGLSISNTIQIKKKLIF